MPAPTAPLDRRGVRLGLILGLVVVIAVPLVVALVSLHGTRFDPIWDDALTELRVRDIAGGHLELVGFYTRISAYGHQGSHPGPAMFMLLAPAYRVLGSSPWSLTAATVLLHLGAVVVALWIAGRRAGTLGVVGAAVAVAVAMHTFGPVVMTRPWNPYFPVLWWFVFLMALWSVLDRDPPMLVVLAVAGSWCAQSHNSYLGLVAGSSVLAFGVAAWRAGRDRADRGRILGWMVVSLVAGLVMWLPPIIDQLTHSPGNLAIMWHYFRHPVEPYVGFHRALDAVLLQLDPWRVATGRILFGELTLHGSTVPGAITFFLWIGTWIAAQRRGLPHALRALHWTVAASLAAGGLSVARIPGGLFWYLVLWGWVNAVVLLGAIGWTLGELLLPHLARARGSRRPVAVVTGALVLVGLAALGGLTAEAATTTLGVPDPVLRRALGPVIHALGDAHHAPPVIVVWTDWDVGGPGREMVDELVRRGYTAGALAVHRAEVTRHHTFAPSASSRVVVLAAAGDRALWSSRPAARRVAAFTQPPYGPIEVFVGPGRLLR